MQERLYAAINIPNRGIKPLLHKAYPIPTSFRINFVCFVGNPLMPIQ